MSQSKIILNWIKPPRFFHWKTFLWIAFYLWILSFWGTTNERLREGLAYVSWIFMTIGISWCTNQPPFARGRFSLSPWVTGASFALLVHEKTGDKMPFFALEIWPILSGCSIFIIEFFQAKFKLVKTYAWVRPQFILLLLLHFNISFWIAFLAWVEQETKVTPDWWRENIRLRRVVEWQNPTQPDSFKVSDRAPKIEGRSVDR